MKTAHKLCISLTVLGLITVFSSNAQLRELAREIEKIEQPVETISNSTLNIVKWIAFVVLVIVGIGFLWLKDNKSELTQKAGNVLLAVGLFFVILQIAELIRP